MKKLILFLLAALSVSTVAKPYPYLYAKDKVETSDKKFHYKIDGRRLMETLEEGEKNAAVTAIRKESFITAANFTLLDFDEEKDEARVRGSKGVVKITKPIWEAYQEAGGGNKYFDVWILKEGDKLVLGIKGLHKEGK